MSGSCHLDRASVIIIRTSYVCQVVLTKTVFKTPCKKWFPQQESFRVKFSNIYFPLQIFRTLSVHSTRSKIKEFAYTSIKHTMRKKTVLSAVICSLNRQPWDASESLEWIPLDALKKKSIAGALGGCLFAFASI